MGMTPADPKLISRIDCLIVGAGPAGLCAATYLLRFRRNVKVVDAGNSRAALIPRTRNLAGFPDGISGAELLSRMRAQAGRYGLEIESGTVTGLARSQDGFLVEMGERRLLARKVLLTTGLSDELPPIPGARELIRRASIRVCPICDGFEVIGKSVAVMGPVEEAVRKAAFLRTFTDRVTVLPTGSNLTVDAELRELMIIEGLAVPEQAVAAIRVLGDGFVADMADGREHPFEILYPALGGRPRSDLLQMIGGKVQDSGYIQTDAHQRCSVEGIYAAGDVVDELNQIAVAIGHAAIAATDIHNAITRDDRASISRG